MGTNYYIANNLCNCCDRYDRVAHLGKSSGGWTFTFRGYRQNYCEDYSRQLNIQNFTEWCKFIDESLNNQCVIKNEYGDTIPKDDLLTLIEQKRTAKLNYARQHPSDSDWIDECGNSFSAGEFC